MIKSRKKQADKYNHQAEWQKLYLRTKTWKTNLLFNRHDLQFIQLTLNRYFLSELNIENVELTGQKEINLKHINTYCNTLIEETNDHLEKLSDLIKEPFKFGYTQFKKENKYLKADINNFVKTLKRVRKDIFEISESVLKDEMVLSIPTLSDGSLNLNEA